MPQQVFHHHDDPQEVVFGSGIATQALSAAVEKLGAQRALILASEGAFARNREVFAPISQLCLFSEVARHVPYETTQRAIQFADAQSIDCIVAHGGGSTIGLAKAIARSRRLPIIAMPTTFSGSEATAMWGISKTIGGRREKTTGIDPLVLPTCIIYDPQLLKTLPSSMVKTSAINSLAHAIDSLWAPGANPISQSFAHSGMKRIGMALRTSDIKATQIPESVISELLVGSYLCGKAFHISGSGLHHKICHMLGGLFDLDHALTHSVVLPQVLAFNTADDHTLSKEIGAALGFPGVDAAQALGKIYEGLQLPISPSVLELTETQRQQAVAALQSIVPASNPRPVGTAELTQILEGLAYPSLMSGFN